MNSRCILKYSAVGLGLQILFIAIGALTGLTQLARALYWPWIVAVGSLARSDAAGHAMAGGGILGFLVGVVVYSLVIGAGLCYWRSVPKVE